jgi:hypothetical protein
MPQKIKMTASFNLKSVTDLQASLASWKIEPFLVHTCNTTVRSRLFMFFFFSFSFLSKYVFVFVYG